MSSNTDALTADNPKLPLWHTIGSSYSTYFSNFGDLLRISWLWLVVIAPLMGVESWLQFSWMAQVMAGVKSGTPPQMIIHQASRSIETAAIEHIASLIWIIAGVSIAVAWHRRIILDEHPRLSGSNIATKSLWRYVGVGLAIILIVIVPVLAVVVPTFLFLFPFSSVGVPARTPTGLAVLIPLIFVIYIAAFAVMLRLSVLLPARAIGNSSLTFKETWRRTRRNTWRIFWGLVICMLPATLAPIAFFISFGLSGINMLVSDGSVGRMVAFSVISMVYYLLILPISIGFMSLSYRHFFVRT